MSKKNSSDKENLATALCAGEYKVIIIGGLGVGKTSLLLRYVHDTFEDRVSRFVAEEKKAVTVGGQEIILDIWDTAGKGPVKVTPSILKSPLVSFTVNVYIETCFYLSQALVCVKRLFQKTRDSVLMSAESRAHQYKSLDSLETVLLVT